MRARRQRRRPRRGVIVLPARPRHPGRGGAPHADRRLPPRGGRDRRRRGRARLPAAPPRRAARKIGGLRAMALVSLRRRDSVGIDVRALRREFPIYENNPGLVFLDSGASAQKPRQVIDGIAEFYRRDYANVHRGVYRLSARSTDRFEEAREKVRAFLNAADEREIVFVRGATEAVNLVAQAWGPAHLKPGDEVV